MFKKIVLLLLLISEFAFCQNNLNYFIDQAFKNSPVLKNYNNLISINELQKDLDQAQNSAFQVYLTSDFLFAPYFNNNGQLISTNPAPKAIGYDAGITNGGLYSAQINVDKNVFNGSILDAYKNHRMVLDKTYQNNLNVEKHNLKNKVTLQYINTLQYLLQYKLSDEIVNNLSKQMEVTGDLVSKGFAKAQDYLLLKIQHKTEQINSSQNFQNYKSELLQLYALCGIKDTQTVMIDTVNLETSNAKAGSNFLHQYYLDSLNIASQQKIFETKYDPQLKLFVNAGLNAVEIDNIQRKFGFSAGFNFSLPILDGNQKDITRQQSLITEKTFADEKKYFEKNILLQREKSKDKISSLRKNLNDYENQISDYQNLLKISGKQLQQGNLSVIEYLTLLKNYIDLQKNKINTEINYQTEISNYNYWNW